MSNRRNWLKQTSIGIVGLGIIPFERFAFPTKEDIIEEKNVGLIRLRSNENPYGPSVLARNAMRDSINVSNRYNWELLDELIGKIAQKHNLTDQNILLGAGSSEILNLVALYCSKKTGNLIIAETTFDYWTVTAENAGLKKIAIPLTADKKHDLSAMLNAIDAETRLIYICNPNNPTGTLCASEALLNFINEATKRTKVLVDEAYLDFTDQPSLANLVTENKNLIIAKTFFRFLRFLLPGHRQFNFYSASGRQCQCLQRNITVLPWMPDFQLISPRGHRTDAGSTIGGRHRPGSPRRRARRPSSSCRCCARS